jgi:peptidoglycan/xylan/chitin deacetylase (PgdA/CDA1 family)
MGTSVRSLLRGLAPALLLVVAGCATGADVPTPTAGVPIASSAGGAWTSSAAPTSAKPTTARPTTAVQTTARPTTARPTTAIPSTATPTTTAPTAPACDLPAALLGRDLTVVPGGDRVVALTFDAGANDDGVAPILATLAEREAAGTFFLTGDFVVDFPASARAIAKRHPIGNHTLSHPDLTTLSRAQVRSQIRQGAARIKDVTGVDPRPYFRFPFGAVDARTIAIVNAECYVPFRWTVDTLGWQGTAGGLSADGVRDRVLAGLRPGAIILMHVGSNPDDGTTFDADALPGLIDELRSRGYTLVTLERVLPATP